MFTLCLIFILIYIPFSKGSHIIGGNIEMKALEKKPGKYLIIMKMYFDGLNSEGSLPNMYEEGIICSKKQNKLLLNFSLLKVKETSFEYSNEYCSTINKLKIIEVRYESTVDLNPDTYNEIEGYYIAHNRCCRNANIVNITNSEKTGLAFYTEFPPLKRAGKLFVNSTPSFDLLSGEYVCLKDSFRYNFDATDPDGDSLVYKLATPIKGNASPQEPILHSPGPYPDIIWGTGYSASNAIHGNPVLTIDSKRGVLDVTPTQLGLYVFSVICEEYRKIGGIYVKIGYTQRDFQLKVIDCPSPSNLPNPSIVAVGVSGNTPTICFGKKVLFQATKNPQWNYQWQLDGDNIPNANFDTLTAYKPGVYDLSVSLKNECTKSRTSAKITLKVLSDPVKLKVNNVNFCEGQSAYLELPVNDINYIYTWYKDTKEIGIGNVFMNAYHSGKYYASIIDKSKPDVCPSVSDTINVIENSNPEATLESERSNNLMCSGESIKLIANIGDKLHYDWYLDNIKIASSTTNEYTVNTVGFYVVMVTDSNTCTNKSLPIKLDTLKKDKIILDPVSPICDLTQITNLHARPFGGFFEGNGIIDKQKGVFDPQKVGLGEYSITYKYTGILDCQSGSDVKKILVTQPSFFKLNPNKVDIWKGASVRLSGPESTGFHYSWQPSNTVVDASSYTTLARPLNTETYTLFLTDQNGCISHDTIQVHVNDKLWIPTIFTPNGDGINDVWRLEGSESYSDISVTVYNRWGEIVYLSSGYPSPFDGKSINGTDLPMDTYIYKISVPSKGFSYSGTVLITR